VSSFVGSFTAVSQKSGSLYIRPQDKAAYSLTVGGGDSFIGRIVFQQSLNGQSWSTIAEYVGTASVPLTGTVVDAEFQNKTALPVSLRFFCDQFSTSPASDAISYELADAAGPVYQVRFLNNAIVNQNDDELIRFTDAGVEIPGDLTVSGSISFSSFLLGNGTAAAPSLAFSSETGTGFFLQAATQPAFTIAGQGQFALFNDTTNPFSDGINDSLIYGGSSSWVESSRVRAVRITAGNGTVNGASIRLTGDQATGKNKFIEFYRGTTLVAQCNASNAWTLGASGSTATHQVNGRVRFEGTDSATAFSSVGTGNNILIRNTNGGANTFAGVYFQDPSSTVYRGGIVGQFVSGAGAAVDLVFLNNSTENGRLSAAGAWTLGASGGTQTHVVNGSAQVVGRLRVIGTDSSDSNLVIRGTSLATGTTQFGVYSLPTFPSGVTAFGSAYTGQVVTTNASFTTALATAYNAAAASKGASNTITRLVNYYGSTQTAGTNNAFLADNSSFTGNWFINSTSTNPSLLSGNLGIGGSPSTVYGALINITGVSGTISSADATGFGVSGSFASTATTGATGVYLNATTANSSFTCPRLVNLWIDNAAKGAASTITRRMGAWIETPTDGTNNAALVLGQSTLNFTGSWNVYSDSTAPSRFGNGASFIVGSAALSTSATDGFLYIPTCAGTPTGVPTTQTGTVAMVFDTTNNRFYIYDGGWISVALA
jgi:hypothetical protein